MFLTVVAVCSVLHVGNSQTNQTLTIIYPANNLPNVTKTFERLTVPEKPKNHAKNYNPVRESQAESKDARKRKHHETTNTPRIARPTTVPTFVTRPTTIKPSPLRQTTLRSTSTTPSESKRKPRNYDDGRGNYNDGRGNYQIVHQSYTGKSKIPTPSADYEPNQIQPLHIKTQVFKKKQPVEGGSIEPTKEQRKKLKLHNLPPNPEEIPTTTWFDNTGKYHYGIIHGELHFTEPPEYAAKQQEVVVTPAPQKVFKSSFRDPNTNLPMVYNDHKGNFLYKSEVHYPVYKNHLYPAAKIYFFWN